MNEKKKTAFSNIMLCGVVLMVLVFFTSFSLTKTKHKKKGRVFTVTIDAGHGGYDPGCQFAGKSEKDITLGISLKLGKAIMDNLDNVKVIYTRKEDEFVELWERADIANKTKSDLFISVHVNSNPNSTVYGTESYTMGLHKTEGNLMVAKRENAVVLMETDYTKRYDGFDPKSPEGHIIFSLYQDAHLEQSNRLAHKVETLMDKANRSSRGVKQAGFLVLWKTTMPSTLIETGFLSNKSDRKFLSSEDGQQVLANAIYKAVKTFQEETQGAE